jgi:integrase
MSNEQLPRELVALRAMLAPVDLAELNGAKGSNREDATLCQLSVRNDYEAIYAWLNEYKTSPSTYRNYQREAERLLLWCLLSRKKALSSLQREDIEAYQDFLASPTPRELWCSDTLGKQAKRGTTHWRPFKSGLNEAGIKLAISVINSLFTYLEQAQYLRRNPIALMRNRVRSKETVEVKALKLLSKILSPRQWSLLNETVSLLPEDTYKARREKYRTQLIIGMFYYLGLRVADLTSGQWNDFKFINGKWWYEIVGKGNKHTLLPVAERLLEIIKESRVFFGYSELPQSDEAIKIIPSWRGCNGLTARQVNHLLKDLAKKTLGRISPQDNDVEKFIGFSSHKIRHVLGSELRRAELPLESRQKLLRHSKVETTLLYSQLDENELHEAINQVSHFD